MWHPWKVKLSPLSFSQVNNGNPFLTRCKKMFWNFAKQNPTSPLRKCSNNLYSLSGQIFNIDDWTNFVSKNLFCRLKVQFFQLLFANASQAPKIQLKPFFALWGMKEGASLQSGVTNYNIRQHPLLSITIALVHNIEVKWQPCSIDISYFFVSENKV